MRADAVAESKASQKASLNHEHHKTFGEMFSSVKRISRFNSRDRSARCKPEPNDTGQAKLGFLHKSPFFPPIARKRLRMPSFAEGFFAIAF